jgi:hypothetical protein
MTSYKTWPTYNAAQCSWVQNGVRSAKQENRGNEQCFARLSYTANNDFKTGAGVKGIDNNKTERCMTGPVTTTITDIRNTHC